MPAALLTQEIFAFLLVFVRVGTALMVLPGIGDAYVPPRLRLLLGLMVTALILPALLARLPAVPTGVPPLATLIVGEAVIGLFLGLIARLLLAALEIAGTVVSLQVSLSNAFLFNPAMASQGTLLGALFTTIGVVLIFVADLHHLMLLAVADSYEVFPPGGLPPLGDMADVVSRLVAQSFRIALQIAAPFLVIGLIFYLGLGLLARLMPQMQVFFVAMPLQIAGGLVVLTLALSAMMLFWLDRFQAGLIGLLAR